MSQRCRTRGASTQGTARVAVNRTWQHLFGVGIVETPDNFGKLGSQPSHPELLDYLATRFMQGGWSLKKLHKDILMSTTWQQSSASNPAFAEKDPFNRLLWRANVRRLEFEPMRDAILYVGGQLDLTVGGKPVDISEGTHLTQRRGASALTRGGVKLSQDHRRSVYGFVDRSDVMEMMGVFDFASPDMPTGKRYQTAVPQQALFLMNSPLVIQQAKRFESSMRTANLHSLRAACNFGEMCFHLRQHRRNPKGKPRPTWGKYVREKFGCSKSKADKCIQVYWLLNTYTKFSYCDVGYSQVADMGKALARYLADDVKEGEFWMEDNGLNSRE